MIVLQIAGKNIQQESTSQIVKGVCASKMPFGVRKNCNAPLIAVRFLFLLGSLSLLTSVNAFPSATGILELSNASYFAAKFPIRLDNTMKHPKAAVAPPIIFGWNSQLYVRRYALLITTQQGRQQKTGSVSALKMQNGTIFLRNVLYLPALRSLSQLVQRQTTFLVFVKEISSGATIISCA